MIITILIVTYAEKKTIRYNIQDKIFSEMQRYKTVIQHYKISNHTNYITLIVTQKIKNTHTLPVIIIITLGNYTPKDIFKKIIIIIIYSSGSVS